MQVTSVAPLRDLSPDDVAQMRAALRGWSERCSSVLEHVDAHMARVRDAAAARVKAENEATDKLNTAMAELQNTDKKMGGGGGGGGGMTREQLARRGMNKRLMPDAAAKAKTDEAMDLDGPFVGEDGKKRASKRKM